MITGELFRSSGKYPNGTKQQLDDPGEDKRPLETKQRTEERKQQRHEIKQSSSPPIYILLLLRQRPSPILTIIIEIYRRRSSSSDSLKTATLIRLSIILYGNIWATAYSRSS